MATETILLFNDAETNLLATLSADRSATCDLEGVRGKVLLSILKTVGIAVTPAWCRMADNLDAVIKTAAPQGPDYEGRILARQGSEYGTTDAY